MKPIQRIALLAVPLILVAGCDKPSINTTAASSEPTTASASPAKTATVGDTLNVTGFGENVAVTLVKADANAKGTDEFNQPDAGKYFYAVQLRVKNLSSSVYSDSPDVGVVAMDAAGQQFQPDFANVTMGQPFGSVNLQSGSTALGVVVFQVPVGDKLVSLQYTANAGMSDHTAQWSLT